MAFDVKRINPIDRQPRKAVGVGIPFSGKAVFNSTYETKEAIKANIINYLLTGKGERYFNPSFGSGLRNELFANINRENLSTLEFKIKLDVENYFPNLEVLDLSINAQADRNIITLSIRFRLTDTLIEDEILINFE
jgi:phage baseplate assembly protein W|tara:strand:- start:185 stop:592 length:408 start_codon:yes stop_codon:yes gene_type:complete